MNECIDFTVYPAAHNFILPKIFFSALVSIETLDMTTSCRIYGNGLSFERPGIQIHLGEPISYFSMELTLGAGDLELKIYNGDDLIDSETIPHVNANSFKYEITNENITSIKLIKGGNEPSIKEMCFR